MTKHKYYVVVAIGEKGDPYVLYFGEYNKGTALDEARDATESWPYAYRTKVLKLSGATVKDLHEAIAELNRKAGIV